MDSTFHFIQRKILFDLLFNKSLHFSDLKPSEMDSTKFMFHLKHLIKDGLVQKQSTDYALTLAGKEIANKLDISSLNFSVQTKVTTVLCGVREQNDEMEVLLYTRSKNPFFGSTGFPTQKVLYGESIENTAVLGLKEETGLTGTPKLFAIRHYLVYSSENLLIEDKLMYAYKFHNPKGDLIAHVEGDYFWIPVEKIKSQIEKPLPELSDILETLLLDQNTIDYKEISVTTTDF